MTERNDPKTGPIDGSILDMIDALNAEADRLIEKRHPDDVLVLRLIALTNGLLVRLHNRIDVVMDADKHLYERIERGYRAEELAEALRLAEAYMALNRVDPRPPTAAQLATVRAALAP